MSLVFRKINIKVLGYWISLYINWQTRVLSLNQEKEKNKLFLAYSYISCFQNSINFYSNF